MITEFFPLPRPRSGGLFAKILLWFAGTVFIVFLITAGMIAYIQRDAEKEHLQFGLQSLQEEGEQFIKIFESDSGNKPEEVGSWSLQIWVFGQTGKLLAEPVSRFLFSHSGLGRRKGAPTVASPSDLDLDHHQIHRKNEAQVKAELASQAKGLLVGEEDFREFEISGEDFLGSRLTGKEGGTYVVFSRNRHRTSRVFFFMQRNPGVWVRFGVLALVVAALCWWLARYLARPLLELQKLA